MEDSVVLAVGWALALASHAQRLRAGVMVARAAHEIRGPLCAAGLALAAQRVDAVERELRRAGDAVEELHRPRRPRREAFDVAALVRASEAVLRSVAEGHGTRLAVVCPGEAWMRGDPHRLAQAVANLVSNAAEHGGGELVRVEVQTDGARLRLVVADDGRGLPEPVAARLAGGRRRSGSTTFRGLRPNRSRRGHGLGIVVATAKLHGGRLRHQPSPSGTVLVLELPVSGRSRGMSAVRILPAWRPQRPLRRALS